MTNIKMETFYRIVMYFLSKRNECLCPPKTATRMFIANLFIETTQMLNTKIDKLEYIHTMEYY